ncbi:hypothetical protein Halha_1293 [Halobacteroides halobius DSM 5150]|uniref:ECF transporter S component n=1 Tax=Halobacteroides halobius (strain ATCC 35273 / DSM 5150 / MD-1) TaxID=748449 RepID=L0KA40_HALHC|nr:ECF transporter S component [Halobacteroides halobius]AGB41239.1 hypothetical protein Halha_1293 [Halobacteroides halobius DSM 5150]
MKYTKWIARTSILLALTLIIQMMGFPPFITGPLVNMMLFVSTNLVGLLGGVLVGGLTPGIAFLRGILPAPLAPVVPFIILGNIILVSSYYFAKRINKYLAIAGAAGLKFLVLSWAVSSLVNVPNKIAKVMQLPQLLTALTGGLLAIFLLKLLNRTDLEEN